MVTGLEQVRGGAVGKAGADRQAVGQSLCERHHVGLHAGMLEREPLAGAPHPALHLVEHEQPAVRFADFPQSAQVPFMADVDAAFALEQFDQHCHHAAVHLGHAPHRLEIVERHAHEACDQRLETRLHLATAGGGECSDGSPVERSFQHHDGRGLDVLLVAVEPRKLDRRFIRLGAGVAEKDVFHAREGAEPVGELFLQRDLVEVGGMDELAQLLAQHCDVFRVAVAETAHRDAGHRVEITLAVRVPQPRALAAFERDGQPGVSVHHVRHIKPSTQALNGPQKQTRRPEAAVRSAHIVIPSTR